MKITFFSVRRRLACRFLLAVFATLVAAAQAQVSAKPGTALSQPADPKRFQPISMPLMFEENAGQVPEGQYVVRLPGYEARFSSGGVALELHGKKRTSRLEISFPGANARARLEPQDRLAARSNYYLGRDRARWHEGLANYSRLTAEDIYPGVNLVFHGNQGELEHDFVVSPGADPARIALKFRGSKRLKLDSNGDLAGNASDPANLPLQGTSYQTSGGGGFAAGFDAGSGQLTYSTLFGGTGDSQVIIRVATDEQGLIYVAGNAHGTATDLPPGTTSGSLNPTFNGTGAVFVLKVDPSVAGIPALKYGTFLECPDGRAAGFPADMAVSAGPMPQIYVTGNIQGSFPDPKGVNGCQIVSGQHSFIAKINPAGQGAKDLIYATFTAGDHKEFTGGMAVDISGNAVIVGNTTSTDLSKGTVFQSSFTGASDGFVAIFDANGNQQATTYLAGDQNVNPHGIAFDQSGGIHVSGTTDSTKIGAFQNSANSTGTVGFTARMTKDLTSLTTVSYWNGQGLLPNTPFIDAPSLAVDSQGNDLLIGNSANAPTTASAFKTTATGTGTVVAKFATNCDVTPLSLTVASGSPSPDPVGFSSSPPFASTLTNTWTIINSGAVNATWVVFDSPTPVIGAGPVFDSTTYKAMVSGQPGSCTTNTGGVTCVIPSIPNGESANVQVAAQVTSKINAVRTFKVIPSIGAAGTTDNNCMVPVQAVQASAIQVSNVGTVNFELSISPVPGQVGVTDQFDLPFTVANMGTVDLTHLSFVTNPDLLGFQVSNVMVSSQANSTPSCDFVGGTGCSDIPLISAGNNFVYTLEGSIPALGTDPATGLPFNSERHSAVGLGTLDGLSANASVVVVNTHLGTNVQVIPDIMPLIPGKAPLVVTFGNVSAAGVTSLSIVPFPPPGIPGYRSGSSGFVNRYDLTTTAQATGATVCLNTPDRLGYLKPSRARMFMVNPVGAHADITTSITPSSATEILPGSFTGSGANPTVLTSVCGQVSSFPSNATVSFVVLEPTDNPPALTGSITTSPTPISGQSSIQLTVQGETDPDVNPCVLGSNASASCSDRPNVKTYIFGSFISSSAAGANCSNGCSFIDISNASQDPPAVTVTMANGGQICLVALDQTINPNPTQVLSGILQGSCATSSFTGALSQAIQLPIDPGGFGFTLSVQANAQQVGVGDPVSIPITVLNIQSVALTNLKLSVNPGLLQGFHLSSVSFSGNATCDLGGTGCSSIPLLAPGASITYTLSGNYPGLDNDPNTGRPIDSENRSIPPGLATVAGLESAGGALSEVNTHLGSNVQVAPDAAPLSSGQPPFSVAFGQVTTAGKTSVTIGTIANPGGVESGYRAGASGTVKHFDLLTTATVTGVTTVCVNTPDSLGYIRPSRARIFLLTGGAQDITSSIAPSAATELLGTSFTGNFANPTALTSVCGQMANFPSGAAVSFAVLEPADPSSPGFTVNPQITGQPISTSKGGSAGQSLVQLVVNQESDKNGNPCTLSSSSNASCSDRPNLKTYIFGPFISSSASGANCSAGCAFIDISNSSNDPSVSFVMGNGQHLCLAVLDQTINPDPNQVLNGILAPNLIHGNCPSLTSPLTGVSIQDVEVISNTGTFDGAGPNSATITAGQTAITNIVLAGPSGSNPAFSCSLSGGGTPLTAAGLSCSLVNQTTPAIPACNSQSSSCPGTIQLVLQTTGGSQSGSAGWPEFPRGVNVILACLLGVISLLRGLRLSRTRRRVFGLASLVLFAALVAGCGGGSGGQSSTAKATPKGTYSIVVTSQV